MFGSTITCVIVFATLVINENQECFGRDDLDTTKFNNCMARSNKNRGPPVYFYAKKAIKNLRISNNPSLDSFFDVNHNILFEDAKAYYLELRQFITFGPFLVSPVYYCYEKHVGGQGTSSVKIDPDTTLDLKLPIDKANDVSSTCLKQIMSYSIPNTENLVDVLHAIYDNIITTEINPELGYAVSYIRHAISNFQLTDSSDLQVPKDFCTKRYTTYSSSERSNKRSRKN